MLRVNKILILLLLLSLLWALYVGGTLPYFLFYSLLFIFIYGYVYIEFQRYCIAAEVKLEKNILIAGEEVECLTIIKCSTVLPAPYIVVKGLYYRFTENNYEGEFINITRLEDCWSRATIRFLKRGIYNFGKLDITIMDMFHNFTAQKLLDCRSKLKVYPRVYDIKRLPLGGKDIYQQVVNIRSNNEDIFAIKDVRKYSEGDSLKKIHWKVSAKYGELYVKNSDNILGEEFVIFLDMNKENLKLDKSGEQEESMVDLSVSMVNFMLNKNICTKVFVNCLLGTSYAVNSKENLNVLMDFFLNQTSDGEEEFEEFLYKNFFKVERNNKIALITGKITDGLYNNIKRLRGFGYSMTLFYSDMKEKESEKIRLLNNLGVDCTSVRSMLRL